MLLIVILILAERPCINEVPGFPIFAPVTPLEKERRDTWKVRG
jgi:hypothetical protein